MTDDQAGSSPAAGLPGRWRKATGDDLYPDVLEFSTGTFLGSVAGDSRRFLLWDAGIYHVDTPASIRLQTSSDELVTYGWSLLGDHLRIAGPSGEVVYQRDGG